MAVSLAVGASVVLLAASWPMASAQLSRDSRLLFDEYFSWKLRRYPEFASLKGFHAHDARLRDRSPAAAQDQADDCAHFLERTDAMLRGTRLLTDEERHYLHLLSQEVRACVDGHRHQGFLFADVSFLDGVQNDLPNKFRADGFTKSAESALLRLRAVPNTLLGITEALRVGIERKMTYAKESLSRVKAQFQRLQVQRAEESDFFVPFKNATLETPSGNVTEDEERRVRLREEASSVIMREVLPAFQALDDFIQNEYMRHVRPAPGLSSLPSGKDFYRACLQFQTSLEGITPEEVHQIGLEGVNEIRSGIERVTKRIGMDTRNRTLAEFFAHIKDQKEQQFTSKKEIFDHFTSDIHDRINPMLQKLFPAKYLVDAVMELDIRPFPKGKSGTAYYRGASMDGRHKGAFFVNVEDVGAIGKFQTLPLSLHEGNPGHHFQLTLNKQLGFPEFLSCQAFGQDAAGPSKEQRYTAHIEGWGLYAEFLGHELGLYQDPYDMLGFYSWNLMRSARLVVDTGIHYLGWSRQRAVDFLLENAPVSRSTAEVEIDRYITHPAQATAYRMGERHIRRLRDKRRTELGQDFDLRMFHVDCLSCLGRMDALEACLGLQERMRVEARPEVLQPRLVDANSVAAVHLSTLALVASTIAGVIRFRVTI